MKPAYARGDDHWRRRMPEKIARGPDAAGAKLSHAQVADLLHAHRDGATPAELMRQFNVSRTTVWRHTKGHIVSRES